METATLGGGCFWCVETLYKRLIGVESAISGYMGGTAETANYEAVCSKTTDHIEVVQVTFDPAVVSYADVLRIFFTIHDPTTENRQGNDVGPQYRSAIFTHSTEQAKIAKEILIEAQEVYNDPIVTDFKEASTFFTGEEYHQGYYDRVGAKNSYCSFVIAPKVSKFRKKYAHLLKPEESE